MSATTAFVGSVPQNYDRYLVPLLFEPYARDMSARLRLPAGGRALEIACGTGVVTRAAADAMPRDAILMATDLNEAMLEVARRHVEQARVTFRVADAQQLPFADASFDVLFCQFGVMFFPDKARAMREARRVLRPGGRYVFNVWDSLEQNPIPATVHDTVGRLLPSNPPDFIAKTPHGWSDRREIERVVRTGGFTQVAIDPVAFPSSSPTAEDAAKAWLEGTPLFHQLQERGVTDFGPTRRAVSEALGARFGHGPCRAGMQALVIEAA